MKKGYLSQYFEGVAFKTLSAVEAESKKYGTTGDKLDMALLVDGLQSEREQGITIDVAYRFFLHRVHQSVLGCFFCVLIIFEALFLSLAL